MNSVLLIEDTSSIQMVYQSLLERAGFRVTCVDTSQAGRRAFDAGAFDVALVDLSLPDGNGLDLLKYFWAQDPQTKAIVVTANGSMNTAVEAMRLGAYDFLVKPVAEQKLLETVQSALASHRVIGADGAGMDDVMPKDGITSKHPLSAMIGQPLEMVERVFIEETIAHCQGSLPKAAQMLGLAPSTLYRKRQSWLE